MQKPTLKLQIFRDIHSKFKNPPWLGFLVLGFLIGLENRYISWKTKLTIDQAIKDFDDKFPDRSYTDVKPEILEEEDGSMSISSPWIKK
tara:strand:+ start:141 stop:407 length:267 start_codon:yes stop_codon:yes gene_type:complete